MNSKEKEIFLNVRPDFWICLFLVFSIIVVYYQVGTFEFTNYDTQKYVFSNRYVKAGLTTEGISWAFTTTYFSNWHPLTWLSHMLDVQLYGLNSGRHHLTNSLLHIANVLLLFGILRRMTGDLWQCGCVAALFALHPLHVESVAWVAERKDLLSTLFGLLTLGFYLRYLEHRDIGSYLLVLLFFILGLMAKPMIVTLPFVLLLLDYWPLQRYRFQIMKKVGNPTKKIDSYFFLVAEKIPLFIISAGSCLVTLYAQMAGGSVGSIDAYPLNLRISNALISYMSYIGKMIWPAKLAAIYPYNWELPSWQVWAACFFIVIFSWLSIRCYQSRPWFLVGWLWYLGTLVPVIGLVQVGMQAMADRYTYIPLIGLFIIIAWGLFDLLMRWHYQKKGFVAIVLAINIILMVVSWKQVGYWENNVSLFKRAVDVTENNHVAESNLGKALLMTGKAGEAVKHFKRSIEIYPRSAITYINLGQALTKQGKFEEAIESCAEAMRIKPEFAGAYNCQGEAQLRLGRPDQAVVSYSQAIRISPEYDQAYHNLGNAHYRLGALDKALSNYLRAIKINPQYADAYNNAGAALIRMGQSHKAIVFFKEAIRINPDYIEAQNNLSSVLAALTKSNK